MCAANRSYMNDQPPDAYGSEALTFRGTRTRACLHDITRAHRETPARVYLVALVKTGCLLSSRRRVRLQSKRAHTHYAPTTQHRASHHTYTYVLYEHRHHANTHICPYILYDTVRAQVFISSSAVSFGITAHFGPDDLWTVANASSSVTLCRMSFSER